MITRRHIHFFFFLIIFNTVPRRSLLFNVTRKRWNYFIFIYIYIYAGIFCSEQISFLNSENTVCLTMEGDILFARVERKSIVRFFTASKAQRSCHWTWRRLAQVTIIKFVFLTFKYATDTNIQWDYILITASVSRAVKGVSLLRERNDIYLSNASWFVNWNRADDYLQSSKEEGRKWKNNRSVQMMVILRMVFKKLNICILLFVVEQKELGLSRNLGLE